MLSETEIETWERILESYKNKYKLDQNLVHRIAVSIAERYKDLLEEGKSQVDEYIATLPSKVLLEQIEGYETIKHLPLASIGKAGAVGSTVSSVVGNVVDVLWTIPLIAGGAAVAVSATLGPIGLALGIGGILGGFRSLAKHQLLETLLEELKPVVKERLLQDLAEHVKSK